MLETIFTFLLLFQLKHFICDYPLQSMYMLGKKNLVGWIKPLLAHSAVHALGTFIVILTSGIFLYSIEYISLGQFKTLIPLGFALAITDLVLHFIVDRIKASPNLGGRWGFLDKEFWWSLGLDQMAHHLINYLFIFIAIIQLGV